MTQILDTVWMVTSDHKNTGKPDGVVYSAPATNPAQAWEDARHIAEPPMTVDEMKKLGYRCKRVRIVLDDPKEKLTRKTM